jgi:hypothetical protein
MVGLYICIVLFFRFFDLFIHYLALRAPFGRACVLTPGHMISTLPSVAPSHPLITTTHDFYAPFGR